MYRQQKTYVIGVYLCGTSLSWDYSNTISDNTHNVGYGMTYVVPLCWKKQQ